MSIYWYARGKKNLVLETKFVCLMKTWYSVEKHISWASLVYRSIGPGKLWEARGSALISFYNDILSRRFLVLSCTYEDSFIPWNWLPTIFLFHGMNLVTLAEGSPCLLITIVFSGILKLSWHLYACAEAHSYNLSAEGKES